MTVAQEEIFGPVLSILAYRDEEHAVEIANGTEYGLAGAVWAADEERAVAFAQPAGRRATAHQRRAVQPGRALRRLQGLGVGRELGRHGLEEFLQTKSLQF